LFFYADDANRQNILKKYIRRIVQKLIRFKTKTYFDPLYEWFILPKYINRDGLDIYHSIGSIVPKKSACITVQTCLDLAFHYYPYYLPATLLRYYNNFVKVSTQNANHVVAISESTKNDLIKIWNIPENKITTIHLGVDIEKYSKRTMSKDDFQVLAGVSSEYLLFVGNLNPRKNVIRLVKAFSHITTIFPDLKLVLVGSHGEEEKNVRILVGDLKLERKILLAGRVNIDILVAYYQNARAFCYPSLYEGFGLPILEAMAAGTPVLTSNTSSMSEISGEAAVLIDPLDIASISEGIVNVLNRKDELVAKGFENVKGYTWEITAKKTFNLYKKLMLEKNGACGI
jgi:glycosyltransferase involved in cell wall biosynthesis